MLECLRDDAMKKQLGGAPGAEPTIASARIGFGASDPGSILPGAKTLPWEQTTVATDTAEKCSVRSVHWPISFVRLCRRAPEIAIDMRTTFLRQSPYRDLDLASRL